MYQLASTVIRIARPRAQAFAYAADLVNYADWFPGVIAIAAQDRSSFATTGKQYAETVSIPLRGRRTVPLRVVDVSTPHRLVTEGELPVLLPRMEIEFHDIDERSCEVRWRMFSRNDGVLARRTVLPLAAWLMGRRARTGMRNLKRHLESAAHTAQVPRSRP